MSVLKSALLILATGLVLGCGAAKKESPRPAVPTVELPGLAELSPADRALAEKQKVCPVSGEPLGSMGKPVKVSAKGRTVFLCCDGCEESIKKDPDKYLAKLDAATNSPPVAPAEKK